MKFLKNRLRLTFCIFIIVEISIDQTDSDNRFTSAEFTSRESTSSSKCGLVKNSPIISFKSNISTFSNKTYYEVPLLYKEQLVFTCKSPYPVEWAFTKLTSKDWSVQEWRDSTNVSKTLVSIYITELNTTVTPKDSSTELICRAVKDDKANCLQTTVSILMKRNNILGNQTMSIKIGPPLIKGKIIPQYSKPEGSNPNCAIQFSYNQERMAFLCSSKTERNLSIAVAENLSPTNCYDQFSCGIFYTNNSQCLTASRYSIGSREGVETFQLGNEKTPGIVICKSDVLTDSRISAAIHYFYSLPKFCDQDSSPGITYPRLYFDLSLVNRNEFLSMCPYPHRPIYKYEFMQISCISSMYVFADGIKLTLVSKNGNKTLVPNKPPKISKEDGYRNYTFDFPITDVNITALECSAPIRKSYEWFAKVINLTVLPSENVTFVGGQASERIEYKPDTVIKCIAKGVPKPTFTWKKNDNDLSTDLEVKHNVDKGWSEIRIPNENASEYYGVYSCEATSDIGFQRKIFYLDGPNENDEVSLWYVWAIILPLVILIVGVVVGFLVWKIIQQTKKLRLLSKAELDEFLLGRPEVLNSQRSSTDYDVNSYAACLPYNKNYEVLKEHLEIDANAVLGSGAYGLVLKGLLTLKNGEKVRVAIKTVKPMDEISYFKALMGELKIMGFIGKHENVVNLLGAYTKNLQNREIYIAIEYCENSCLLNYLRGHRLGFVNFVQNGELQININRISYSTPNQAMSTLTLLRWGLQIANGMDFLYHKKVIHGDLAARNIMLSANLTAKIGDFGLSRQLFEYANYIKKHQSPLPWRWLALECLQDMKFSSKSDVWAYGVCLWELFSLGQVPYAGMSYNDEFMDQLIAGKRPSRPQYATKDLYDLMHSCWSTDPQDRPSFLQIKQFFDHTIRSLLPEEYVDLEDNLLKPFKLTRHPETENEFDRSENIQIQMNPSTNPIRTSIVYFKT